MGGGGALGSLGEYLCAQEVREGLWGECHGAQHFREVPLVECRCAEEAGRGEYHRAEEVSQELWVEYQCSREARWGGLDVYHVARSCAVRQTVWGSSRDIDECKRNDTTERSELYKCIS